VTTFDYRTAKDGTVFISWEGRDVTTLRGSVAQKFLARAEGADDDVAQELMRLATGNFKHGNERR
jgi:hypothetical protein